MNIILTGINFNYANGLNAAYTGVNLNFNSSGTTFNLNGFITVTNDQYATADGDSAKLTDLIKQQIITNLNSTTPTA